MSQPAMTGATADRIEDLVEAADRLREVLAAHPAFPALIDLDELAEIVQVARRLAALGTAVACSSAAAWTRLNADPAILGEHPAPAAANRYPSRTVEDGT